MISVERALYSISGKNAEEVREFVRNRIMGTDITSFGSGHSAEPSEDVVIQLLNNPQLDGDQRKAVVDGWMDVYREVREWLDDPEFVKDVNKWNNVVANLCRVVDIAEPPEFEKYIKRLITELLDEETCPADLLEASVKAYMAYAQDEKSVRFWEDAILVNKNVAAYGFNALLDINPEHARIEEHLLKLWQLQVEDNWPVNSAFLLRRAARVRDESALINRVLLKLKNKDDSLWEKIKKELNQPWSKQWLVKLVELEKPKHQGFHRHIYTSERADKIQSSQGLELELEDVEALVFRAGKFYVKGTMSFDTPSIKKYGDLKRNVKNPGYVTRVMFEHHEAKRKEIEYVSTAKIG